MMVYGGKHLQVWAHKVLSVCSYGGIPYGDSSNLDQDKDFV